MTTDSAGFQLLDVLLNPRSILAMDGAGLAHVISQGRVARLLASLGEHLDTAGVLRDVPFEARRHIESATLVFEKQRRDLAYDAEKLRSALDAGGIGLVLLKGGAYITSDLLVGRGRLITDIDIIVPRQQLATAEKLLHEQGWESHELDPYNESYYRRWSHEVPALINRQRGTTLDLHHNILPPTAGPTINPDLLFEELRELRPGVFTLSYRDMVIHSATHLFHEGEFHHGLRDLWDLNLMLRDFPERQPDFWRGLLDRARELELEMPVSHCLHYTQMLFATPIPEKVLEETNPWLPALRRPLMDILFRRAFRPSHPDCQLPLTGPALSLLYLRSHYLRMPLYLLLPHLLRKAWMRRFSEKGESLDTA